LSCRCSCQALRRRNSSDSGPTTLLPSGDYWAAVIREGGALFGSHCQRLPSSWLPMSAPALTGMVRSRPRAPISTGCATRNGGGCSAISPPMNTERPRHYFGFNCTVCETFVMTENDEWACLCPRCYHHQQPDLENWLRDG
jgi:hypothetical protein